MKCEKQTFKEQKIPFNCSQIGLTVPNYVLSKENRPTNGGSTSCGSVPSTDNEFQVWAETLGIHLNVCKMSSWSFSIMSTFIILGILVKPCICWGKVSVILNLFLHLITYKDC